MNQTIKNLAKAFIGESQARNRYAIYAKQAEKEGFLQISAIFLETAEQEREHAKWLFRMIQDLKKQSGEDLAEIAVESGVPAMIGSTAENLKYAISGENYEYTSMYPEFARVAQEEGLFEISARIKAIAKAEMHHESRYKKLLIAVEAGTVLKKENEADWECMKCGYVHTGNSAPETCPSCGHPKEYYRVLCESY